MGTINAYRICLVFLVLLISKTVFAGGFEAHKQNLQNMVVSISDTEGEIKKMIHHKRSQHDREAQKKTMKEIEESHKKLLEAYKKYNEEVNHVKFRHPEQGDEGERVYTILKPRTLEQIENDVGLEGKLDRVRRKMEAQYNQAPPPPKTPMEELAEEKKIEEKLPERIILRK